MGVMTDDRSEKIAVRRKRLRFRCQRRGFKEVDLIFATFAESHLADMNEQGLDQLEMFLDAPDHDVFAWLQGETPVPVAFDNLVFAQLRALCRRKSPTWNV
jgi:antitoxin CptB